MHFNSFVNSTGKSSTTRSNTAITHDPSFVERQHSNTFLIYWKHAWSVKSLCCCEALCLNFVWPWLRHLEWKHTICIVNKKQIQNIIFLCSLHIKIYNHFVQKRGIYFNRFYEYSKLYYFSALQANYKYSHLCLFWSSYLSCNENV